MPFELSQLIAPPTRRKRILTLGLPIIGGMVSQNVLNLVDTAMVGVLGNEALAAVGLGGFANFLATASLMGMSSSVQAMAARRKGEGRLTETAVPLNGGILLALVVGIPVTILGWVLTPHLFPLLSDDPAVGQLGSRYLQVRLLSVIAVGMNYAFRGFWNAVDQPGRYMRTLILMHLTNIFFNWVFIFGHLGAPTLGATGAAVASTISTFVGTAYYYAQGFKLARDQGFLEGLPTRETLVTMVRQALPAGIERTMFSGSLVIFFWIIGKIGTAELAAANVLINLALVAILPGLGFGLAAGTLSGQALGRGDPEDAKRWGWEVTGMGIAVVAVLGLPALAFPDLLLKVFIHDPPTLEMARLPLRIMAIYMPIDTVSMVLMNALLGVGAARTVMVVSVTLQWFIFLPAAWVTGPMLGFGLLGVWLAQAVHRTLQAGIMIALWARSRWAGGKL